MLSALSFTREWWDLQFNDRFLRNFFITRLITLRVFARKLRGNRRKFYCHIFVPCLNWDTNSGFTSNTLTHYLLDYGDLWATYQLKFESSVVSNLAILMPPMSPGGRTSSVFYTHRTWTSTIFVKKSVKMHSLACPFNEGGSCRFLPFFNYTLKKLFR